MLGGGLGRGGTFLRLHLREMGLWVKVGLQGKAEEIWELFHLLSS